MVGLDNQEIAGSPLEAHFDHSQSAVIHLCWLLTALHMFLWQSLYQHSSSKAISTLLPKARVATYSACVLNST